MQSLSKAAALLVAACALCAAPSRALTLYHGWDYALDSTNDGSGGDAYEFRGMAFRSAGGLDYFAFSSGMPQGGNNLSGVLNGRLNYGDLFLNFSGHNLDTRADFQDPLVFGIRFDPLNDSLGNTGSNSTLGVYRTLTAVSLPGQNNGYATLQAYTAAGFGRTYRAMGDLNSTTAEVYAYLGSGAMYTNISGGVRVGDITLLDRAQLVGLGLDFAHFGADPAGNSIFGFAFSRTLLPEGQFTAHLFQECINDGMALQAANVPEPGIVAMAGSSLLALGGLALRRRRYPAVIRRR